MAERVPPRKEPPPSSDSKETPAVPPGPLGSVPRPLPQWAVSRARGTWCESLEAAAAARQQAAASDFRDLLLRLRQGAPRGEAFARGLRALLSLGMQAGTVAFISVADSRLQAPQGWMKQLGGDLGLVLADRGATGCGTALRRLTLELEQFLASRSPLPDFLGAGFEWLDAGEAPALGRGVAVKLVYFPVALYVRNSLYLYEMLSRLRAAFPGEASTKGLPAGADGPTRMRFTLDAGGLGYSFMVYAICAALQALLLLRRTGMSRSAGDSGPFPVELLGSSAPPLPPKPNPHPMAPLGTWAANRRQYGRALVFRGLWVGECVDEELLRFQRCLNSFSRSFQGALRVLDFYAEADGSPMAEVAQRARHALIYVLRMDWADRQCFALPLQLFEGPVKQGTSEKEVTLPPYARYFLEDDLAVCSTDFAPGGEGPARLDELHRRWGKDIGKMAPPLVEALRGNFVCETLRKMQPKISIRFVRDWTLAPAAAELFSEPKHLLYAFPP